MMLLRFIILAGVLVAVSVYAPQRATASEAARSAAAFNAALVEQKKDDVPRPRPTPGPRDNAFAAEYNEQKKADPPPRPRPKPGPKDGGEDE